MGERSLRATASQGPYIRQPDVWASPKPLRFYLPETLVSAKIAPPASYFNQKIWIPSLEHAVTYIERKVVSVM
ncbi:hypothetical protein [Stenotrophomonas sp. NPDC077461]|uniref:hypothetical protein n=1 Tax=Stenotrophomonas sp. NPDC077461 TaxID=3414698 RepID=UPI003C2C4DC5